MKRIHIVGCGPRSGTTLIYEMMLACFDIDVFDDHENVIYKWPSRKGKIYLTKKPRDIMLVKPALFMMRTLYVIYMLRDPRDMIVSRHRRDPGRYWSGLRFWKTYTPYGEELATHPRFITLLYEELVHDPDKVQDSLLERIPFLEKKAPFSRYHEMTIPSEASLEALGSVREISASSIGNWRNHKPRVLGQIQLHGAISEDLIRYGYEKDNRWEKELEGIDPDFSDSHWPEYFSARELRMRAGFRNLKALWAWMGQYSLLWPMRKLALKIIPH